MPAIFGTREATRAAGLSRQVKRARQRQADLAIAAWALEHSANLWTRNRADFDDTPGLTLYGPPRAAREPERAARQPSSR
jgi:predicted nucleic acid-binding protein